MSNHVTVVHNPDLHRYELHDADTTIGFTEYVHAHDGAQVVFVHTEVDDSYAGQGLAGQLAAFALDDVRTLGKRIVPVCPYIASYVRKHSDYDDIVDWPEDE